MDPEDSELQRVHPPQAGRGTRRGGPSLEIWWVKALLLCLLPHSDQCSVSTQDPPVRKKLADHAPSVQITLALSWT